MLERCKTAAGVSKRRFRMGDYVMEEKNWLEAVAGNSQLAEVQAANGYTEKFGLALTQEQAHALVAKRNDALRMEGRVEFGAGILKKLIYAFCDSNYVSQGEWVEILERLTEIFYLYKNETEDELTDDELIAFMREQYEEVCHGDLDYLEGTCLELFAEAVRGGYRGYEQSGGYGEYEQFDLLPRWSREDYGDGIRAALNGPKE